MLSIKNRISNVLAWLGFTFMPVIIILLITFPVRLMDVSEILENSPPSDCNSCYFLTYEDIEGSKNLRSKHARIGDWIANWDTDEKKFERLKPLLFTKILDSLDAFFEATEDYADLFPPHFIFWLFCLIINYILIGSLRTLPWRSVD